MDEYIKQLKEQVLLLPDLPGVYRFLDDKEVVIYVGKAKNLKKRVSSYFNSKGQENRKVAAMVRHIRSIVHIVVSSEGDALLLENSMIKSLQPKYNILLKDDKTFPWIVVTAEPYARVMQTRKVLRDRSSYYGPYASVMAQKSMLDLARKLYCLRTCHLKLTPEKVREGKFDLCLEYHLGNCKAPCVDNISLEEYQKAVVMASDVLRGNLARAKEYLAKEMEHASEAMRFEEAHRIKERMAMLENYKSKSVVVSASNTNIDIFYPIIEERVAYCNYMHVADGAIINSYTIEMRLNLEEDAEKVLQFAINSVLDKLEISLCREVLVPFMPEMGAFEGVNFVVPSRGDKLKLLLLSEKNCRLFRLERSKQLERVNPERHTERVMERMKKDLHLSKEPRHIECFDNSNIQGAYPVSSCVVFKDGKPFKSMYRHFNIKSVEGIDDFASMRETVLRRYSAMLREGAPLPDLIVVDGGKGQLSSAYATLQELGISDKVEIVGLAKRLEEIFYPYDTTPLYLDKSGETLRVLMHIRDEAHRFGITFHRQKRSVGAIKSELEEVPSLGQRSVEKLLKHFKSVKNIKLASVEELSAVVGSARAIKIDEYFKNSIQNEKGDICNKQ